MFCAMSTLQTLPADAADEIRAVLDEEGGVIVQGYLDPDHLAEVREALITAIADLPWCNTFNAYEDTFFGLKTKRLHGLLRYGPAVEKALMHPLALTLAERQHRGAITMSTGELMAIGPEETQQRLHRDAVSWERSELTQDFLFSVNIALTDFRRDNGATVVVPGSHRWDGDRTPRDEDFAYAEMSAGSALLYSGQVLHSGGQNDTSETRIGLYFGYIPAWLRPLENAVHTHGLDALQRLGPDTQAMLGLSEEGFVAYL